MRELEAKSRMLSELTAALAREERAKDAAVQEASSLRAHLATLERELRNAQVRRQRRANLCCGLFGWSPWFSSCAVDPFAGGTGQRGRAPAGPGRGGAGGGGARDRAGSRVAVPAGEPLAAAARLPCTTAGRAARPHLTRARDS